MSRADAWMPLYIGDYLADTMHLNGAEHGAYMLLLMHQWRNGPLPNDDRQLAAIARTDAKTWREIGSTVREFFETTAENRLSQKRLQAERNRVEEISAKRAAAGRKGADNRWSDDEEPSGNGSGGHGKPMANGMANAMAKPEPGHTQSQSQLESKKDPRSPSAHVPPPGDEGKAVALPKPVRVKPAAPVVTLPDWLPAAAWERWDAYRQTKPKRAPWNQHTADLCLRTLTKLRAEGSDPQAVIDQSMISGWPGLFPAKATRAAAAPASKLAWMLSPHATETYQ